MQRPPNAKIQTHREAIEIKRKRGEEEEETEITIFSLVSICDKQKKPKKKKKEGERTVANRYKEINKTFIILFRYAIQFQMFSIRQFTNIVSRRIYSYSSKCYQSNTSSTDETKKTSSTNVTSTWATSDTNGLVKQLSARIKSGGPITVAEFMRESLLNPKYVRYLY